MTNILEITDESGFTGQSYTATSQGKKQKMHEDPEEGAEEDARRCTKMQKKKKKQEDA